METIVIIAVLLIVIGIVGLILSMEKMAPDPNCHICKGKGTYPDTRYWDDDPYISQYSRPDELFCYCWSKKHVRDRKQFPKRLPEDTPVSWQRKINLYFVNRKQHKQNTNGPYIQ